MYDNLKLPYVYKSKHDACSEYIFIEIGFQPIPLLEIMMYVNRHE